MQGFLLLVAVLVAQGHASEVVEGVVVQDNGDIGSSTGGSSDDAQTTSEGEELLQLPTGPRLCQFNGGGVNIAPLATPSSSGGGVGNYGPQRMNDEDTCPYFHWPYSSNTSWPGTYIQYDWNQLYYIDRFVIRTDRKCVGPYFNCGTHEAGRNLQKGRIYWRDLWGVWQFGGQFDMETWPTIVHDFRFPECIVTTGLRLTGLQIPDCGTNPRPVIHEWEVCQCRQ